MMQMAINSSHVEVNLKHQRLSHINVWSFSHILTIAELDITIGINNEKLFVLCSHFIKLVIFFNDFLLFFL
jgi:hypothetical protein